MLTCKEKLMSTCTATSFKTDYKDIEMIDSFCLLDSSIRVKIPAVKKLFRLAYNKVAAKKFRCHMCEIAFLVTLCRRNRVERVLMTLNVARGDP